MKIFLSSIYLLSLVSVSVSQSHPPNENAVHLFLHLNARSDRHQLCLSCLSACPILRDAEEMQQLVDYRQANPTANPMKDAIMFNLVRVCLVSRLRFNRFRGILNVY